MYKVTFDEKSREILNPYEGAYKDLGEKETKKSSSKKEKPASRSKGKNKEKRISRILLKFNKNIHQATKRDKEKIRLWSSSLEEGVIIAAISEAVKYNARHIGYIETVIKNWMEQGITTMEKLNKSKEKPDRSINRCNVEAYVYID